MHPNEVLVFEDSLAGIQAAKGAGIEVVNVYDKYSDTDRDKIAQLSDYFINDYAEFLPVISSQKVE